MLTRPCCLAALALALAGCADTLNDSWSTTQKVATPRPAATVPPRAVATAPPTVTLTPGDTGVSPGAPVPTAASAEPANSYKGTIAPLIQSRCASCHGPNGSGSDSLILCDATGKPLYSAVSRHISAIISTTRSGKMPEGGPRFTTAEVAALQAWQAQGTPNN